MESVYFELAADTSQVPADIRDEKLSTRGTTSTKGERATEATPHDRDLITRFLKQLPKGQLDWDNEVPKCDPSYLYDRLSLSDIRTSSRAEMTWESLLQALADRRHEFPNNDLYQLVILSFYRVALKSGAKKNVLDQYLSQAISNSSQTLKLKLGAALKCNAILAYLEGPLHTRAAEVPLRGMCCRALDTDYFSNEENSVYSHYLPEDLVGGHPIFRVC